VCKGWTKRGLRIKASTFSIVINNLNTLWYELMYMRVVIENWIHLRLLSSPLCVASVGWGFWGIVWFSWVIFELRYLQWVQSMLYEFKC